MWLWHGQSNMFFDSSVNKEMEEVERSVLLKFSTSEERASILDINFEPEVSSSLSSSKNKKKRSSQTVDKKN